MLKIVKNTPEKGKYTSIHRLISLSSVGREKFGGMGLVG